MSINQPTLIYANVPYKKFRWVGLVTVAQLTMAGIGLSIGREGDNVKRIDKQTGIPITDEEFLQSAETTTTSSYGGIKQVNYLDLISFNNIVPNLKAYPGFCCALIFGSLIATLPFCYYTKRSIHTITLIPKDRVIFTVFSPFSFRSPKTIELPLKHVSCRVPRKAAMNYSILRFKDHMGFYLVHKTEGRFLDTKLYDKNLGYENVWK